MNWKRELKHLKYTLITAILVVILVYAINGWRLREPSCTVNQVWDGYLGFRINLYEKRQCEIMKNITYKVDSCYQESEGNYYCDHHNWTDLGYT